MLKFSLPRKIILEGSGFEWAIKFEQVNPEGFACGQMTLKMQTVDQERDIGCTSFSSSYNDLIELADYFDHHIKRLIQDPWSDSDVFVQYSLEFQIQALCGEVSPDMEGDFALRIMLLAGQTSDDDRVHVGIESSVDVAKCNAFVNELREFLKTWSKNASDLSATHLSASLMCMT